MMKKKETNWKKKEGVTEKKRKRIFKEEKLGTKRKWKRKKF